MIQLFLNLEGMLSWDCPEACGSARVRFRKGGGDQPRWRGDGRELFYVASDGMMTVVPIKAAAGPKPSFEAGAVVPLFESHILSTPQTNAVVQYDVTADGKRFLVVTGNAAASTAR